MIDQFRHAVLNWFKQHGRKQLPWQQHPTPYRVWVSEIMLQQTQVNTVIPYFQKFMESFPDVFSLSKSKEDKVLHLWTGLGYYARARNLHKTAKIIAEKYQGKFPKNIEGLEALPGIGRSTAGAILSLSMKQRAPILDGNVKRVLSRFHILNQFENLDELWNIAEAYTPQKNIAEYTQAMMDLGAMICTRSQPKCEICPLQKNCKAKIQNLQNQYPGKKPSKLLPVKKTILLILKSPQGKILLEKRPSTGIWGGLWSLPEFSDEITLKKDFQKKYGIKLKAPTILKPFRHTFTHFHLDIQPMETIINKITGINKIKFVGTCWYDPESPQALGLAAPVKKLLLSA
jgi:A/G-specific adenine glycosylase